MQLIIGKLGNSQSQAVMILELLIPKLFYLMTYIAQKFKGKFYIYMLRSGYNLGPVITEPVCV